MKEQDMFVNVLRDFLVPIVRMTQGLALWVTHARTMEHASIKELNIHANAQMGFLE